MPAVHGTCDPWFERVREVFSAHFEDGLEHGAAVCIEMDGRVVVDLWAGQARRADECPWERDTLVNLYSATKGLSALCVHFLSARGQLDLDAPVARYWPEFGESGKAAVTIEQLLSHQAGLAAINESLPHEALYDHARMASLLAAQAPLWPPGDGHGYHAVTFGFLVGELVRRVAGMSLGRFLATELAGPLGADVHVGLGPEHDYRVAHVTRPLGISPPPGQPDLVAVLRQEPASLSARAFGNPAAGQGAVNTRRWRAAELPGSNGHGNARGLARVYGALASGNLLPQAALERCQVELSAGPDRVLRLATRFAAGLMVTASDGPGYFSPNEGAIGHPGMGGSLGFADPSVGLGFGYTMNRAGASILVGERPRRLLDACYESL